MAIPYVMAVTFAATVLCFATGPHPPPWAGWPIAAAGAWAWVDGHHDFGVTVIAIGVLTLAWRGA